MSLSRNKTLLAIVLVAILATVLLGAALTWWASQFQAPHHRLCSPPGGEQTSATGNAALGPQHATDSPKTLRFLGPLSSRAIEAPDRATH